MTVDDVRRGVGQPGSTEYSRKFAPDTRIMFTLETDRLRLRHLTEDDADALFAVLGDPVALHLWPRSYTCDQVADWIRWCQESYRKHGYGLWAVVLKRTGECIGDCGITVQTVDGQPEDEIGYHLQRKHWGNGYATEAAAACRDYAFGELGKSRVISLIMPNHLKSRAVAERIGMRVERETVRKGIPHWVYSMDRPLKQAPTGTPLL